jgi:hypothetical protein
MASIKMSVREAKTRGPLRKLNELVREFLEWFDGTGDELDSPV